MTARTSVVKVMNESHRGATGLNMFEISKFAVVALRVMQGSTKSFVEMGNMLFWADSNESSWNAGFCSDGNPFKTHERGEGLTLRIVFVIWARDDVII
jgi:hypothetical protein